MKYFKQFIWTILIGVMVALTYFVFERAVHHSISYIWNDLFNTGQTRLLVIPLALVLSLIYFGVQHALDPRSENVQSEGLGGVPTPTIKNYLRVLCIGFFSLIAGASLGPEAILVPACIIVGTYIGTKLIGKQKSVAQEFGALGFVSLFAAFFHSFIFGLLALLLVKRQFKLAITPRLFALGAIGSVSTYVALNVLEGKAYMTLPSYPNHMSLGALLAIVPLFLAGYCSTFVLKFAHDACGQLVTKAKVSTWWQKAFVAAAGLSILYLVGGPLVEFTGNESIAPMFKQAASLGVAGLIGVFVVKLLVIAWSKALGYRGGLIFPTLFAASVLAAIAQLAVPDIHIGLAVIVAFVGFMAADKKAEILL